jgi:putative aldouronate transport system permease protein
MMIRERSWKYWIVDALIYIVLGLLFLTCVLPFVHEIALSLSSRPAVSTNHVGLWPVGYNLDNYRAVLTKDRFLHALGITLLRLLIGVPATLLVTGMVAYPMSLERIHMPGRKTFMMLMIFAGLFQVGLIPRYLSYKYLGLIDNFAVFILPLLLTTYNVVLMTSFFKGIPYELVESAMLDGANHWQILSRIMMPLSRPVMAAIGLFTIVTHWNAWFDGVVFVRSASMWPLQTYLYSMLTTQELAGEYSSARFSGLLPNVSPHGAEAALIIFSIAPLVILYPILQRYFISGLTLGAVKE